MAVLPPNVSAEAFEAAMREFADVVGNEWVFSSDADVELYRDSYSPFMGEAEDPVPSAAVAPQTTEQVQECVRIANRYVLPLWVLSTGKNLGYGGSAPRLSGSVMIDLKRMDRILEINETNHYALVEPGVSYFDLYREIQRQGLKLWIDPPDPGWGSLVGNALERGGGYTPMRDHFAAHCGMEIVLPDGEVLRTGMGALPAPKPGSSTTTDSVRMSTACSRSRVSASSRRWASGCCLSLRPTGAGPSASPARRN